MVDALVDEPVNPELLALLADEELHAPALLDFEVASALRGHALGGKLDQVRLDELEAPLVTADAKLNEARRVGVDVRVLR